MSGQVAVALLAGLLFGAGLAVSGMADAARVRAFLDIFGRWDPTLAFVMGGALLPMPVAWRLRAKLRRPLAAPAFDLPAQGRPDARLLAGAAIFGCGWGVAGLCPGPALTDLAISPPRAALFAASMLAGMALHRLGAPRPAASTSQPPAGGQAR